MSRRKWTRDELAQRIVHAREVLVGLERDFEMRFGGRVAARRTFGLSRQITDYLEQHPGTHRPVDLRDALGVFDHHNLRSTLATLAAKGAIERLGRGMYRARGARAGAVSTASGAQRHDVPTRRRTEQGSVPVDSPKLRRDLIAVALEFARAILAEIAELPPDTLTADFGVRAVMSRRRASPRS